jgi:hypothetical protein
MKKYIMDLDIMVSVLVSAPWTGKQLSKLVFSSNSKDLNISKIYKGLPKKFIFPKLRILYFRIAVLFYNIKDKFNI